MQTKIRTGNSKLDAILEKVFNRGNSTEHEFFQTITEMAKSLKIFFDKNPEFIDVFERMLTPDYIHIFKVDWTNKNGEIKTNTGYRVQFNGALGQYKGGLRFHPSVTVGTLKFLGLEQTFKNAITGLHIGGAKGGSDFDPKGKTDAEIKDFSAAFMLQLHKYIGFDIDVPAGDIGVGELVLGYMCGAYKKLTGNNAIPLTGKPISFGGSHGRKEATGYGLINFSEQLLKIKSAHLENMKCSVSGSGNVAIHAIEKLQIEKAIVVTCSDSTGCIYDPDGINLKILKEIKEVKKQSLSFYAKKVKTAEFTKIEDYEIGSNKVWSYPVSAAFPCATQNELSIKDAKQLVKNGCILVAEGANMPTESDAVDFFLKNKVLFGPAKSANAGGVAISEVEMEQNTTRHYFKREEVLERLEKIMKEIFDDLQKINVDYELDDNFVDASNILGFKRVADAMLKGGF